MTIHIASPETDRYLSPTEVTELIPGMTKGNLAQLRFKGQGPAYRRVTPKTIVYRLSDVLAYVESTARQGTSEVA